MRQIIASTLLLASLTLPAAAKASTLADDATAPTPVRVSTGVNFPTLVSSVGVKAPETFPVAYFPGDAQVALTLTVDESGRPQNIKVVKSSLNSAWDARVVDAVSQFRYKAGTVDNQPVPVNLNLTVNIEK